MKIYTRTGDGGETGLFGGERVSKASVQMAAIGSLDELNAQLGATACQDSENVFVERIHKIQAAIFDVGAEVATVPSKAEKLKTAAINAADIALLEQWIDASEAQLAPLQTFVLPGGSNLAAEFHRSRTAARRAERELVALDASGHAVRADVLSYINRLSDLCFSWARLSNHQLGVPDVLWFARKI